nr:DUF4442 domain-containing protein [uncultured Deefgea sp.]
MSPRFRNLVFSVLRRPKLASALLKLGFNLYPAIRRTGCRVKTISADLRDITVELPLNWKTRNINGSLFGGSMFAATDPFYMSMLYFNLGDDYVVWDKGGTIRFKRTALSTLTVQFKLDEAELTEIHQLLAITPEITRTYPLQLINNKGDICAEVERVVYIAHKSAYEQKQSERKQQKQLESARSNLNHPVQ